MTAKRTYAIQWIQTPNAFAHILNKPDPDSYRDNLNIIYKWLAEIHLEYVDWKGIIVEVK